MSNCGGAAESAMFCTDPALPSFAVPDERSWSRIPTSDGVLQPGDDFRRGLRLLPFSARPQMMRWTDSAMFNQEPLNGVYSGITPCANNHMTIDELKWPARLSQMRI